MRILRCITLLAAALPFLACSGPGADQEERAEAVGSRAVMGPGPEAAEVEAVAGFFLEALSAADTAALAGLFAPGGMIYSIRQGPEGPVARSVTRESFLESLGGETQGLLERMWSPTVQVQDGVAVVWTPYDFHLNGEFSHCGVDIFTMVKGVDGWQVTAITYNVVQEGCDPSPLGPPTGG